MMDKKVCITVSRYWNNPQIMTVLWKDGISLTMNLDDFVKALKEEVGSITWVFRKSTFEEMMDTAIKSIVEKIKEESVKVVS